jgi:hypothetical protein
MTKPFRVPNYLAVVSRERVATGMGKVVEESDGVFIDMLNISL